MIENLADGVSVADADYIDTMHQQVQRLAHLVDQLLSLSRLESGQTELHREPTPIDELIDSVVNEARWRHPSVVIDRSDVPLVNAVLDPVLMHQVLTNLIENAIRHGAPPISVSASADASTITFRVVDHGPGIPVESAERVFGRFERLDRSRRGTGSGLGLSIVAGIIERHGGTVAVHPVDPHGAEFVVTIPLHASG
jgi:signal transduction histidine kinase